VPIRLLALDLDGTLMAADHVTISQRNKNAIRSAAERGIQVVLASGRPLSLMEPVAADLGCVRYLITANGAVTVDRETGNALFHHRISAEPARKILRLFEPYALPLELYACGRIYVKKGFWNMEHYQKQPWEFLQMRAAQNIEVASLPDAVPSEGVEKFNVDGIHPEIKDQILARIEPIRDLTHTYIPAYDNLEINHMLATKGQALRNLCEGLGIFPAEVMAFGDSSNDVSMLEWAQWSYAMASGSPEALLAACARTGANTDSGVAQVLERQLHFPIRQQDGKNSL